MSLELTLDFADSKTFRIPLRWNNQPFAPSASWRLVWTMKTALTDADVDALIQKATSGLGITVTGDNALVSVVPDDTRLAPVALGTYYWGILAQHTTTGERHTVAEGTLVLNATATQEDEVSVTVYTTEPPVFPVNGAVRYDVAQTLTSGEKLQARTNIGLDTLQLTESVSVANTAARLALTLAQALNKAIVEADTGDSYMLVTGGTPATSGDWLQIGDRDVTWTEVSGKPTTFAPIIGSGAGDAVAGNDARLTDARTPTAHTHVSADVTDATSNATPNTVVKRHSSGSADFGERIKIVNDGLGVSAIIVDDLLLEHPQILQNASGTIALTSDITGTNSGTNTGDETGARIAALITAATGKATPVDADEIPITDSAASFGLKKLTWANLKATVKTYFDTLYVALTGNQTVAGIKTFTGLAQFENGINTFGVDGTTVGQMRLYTTTAGGSTNLTPTSTSFININYPDASGTFALTSDLGAYLPLAGGAMTGALDMGGFNLSNIGTISAGGTNTWNGSTITGAQAFSSTTRPVSSATGSPEATSLVTSTDLNDRLKDPTIMYLRDDFHAPNSGKGELDWYYEPEGTAAAYSTPVGTYPHSGIVGISSGTDILKGNCLYKGYLAPLISTTNWEACYVFKIEQTTNCDVICGFTSNGGNVGLYGSYGAASFGVRYSSAHDTDFMFYSKNTSSDFAANDSNNYKLTTGVAVDTNFHTLKIRSTSVGVIEMKFDSGAWTTIAHVNLDSSYLPINLILARAASTQVYAQFDYFSFIQTGLAR